MPILVKDYTWEESEETVRVTVPLKGVKPTKVDIFSTEEYIKVSYPPYLFEVFLFAHVEDVKNKATVGSGAVVFSLIKKEAGLWNTLQPDEVEDKEFMKRKREEAIQRAHDRAIEEQELRETKKREQERYALREQMKMEEEERKRIHEIKEQERQQASAAIEELKHRTNHQRALSNNLDSDDDDDDDDENDDNDDDHEDIKAVVSQNKTVLNGYGGDDESTDNSQKISAKHQLKSKAQGRHKSQTKKKADLLDQPLPAPRESGCIQVSFTPRQFKTAARESKAPEEEEWLKKVAEASRNKKTLKDDPDAVDMEEMNPLWLKDKGGGFYKSGNYVAAINAFTAALMLDSNIPSLFSNRAACHLHLKQYKECIQDCTNALELLTPPVPDNASSRCRALVRRGTALYHFNAYVEALKDYDDALQLDPKNESLQQDAERIRNIIQGTS